MEEKVVSIYREDMSMQLTNTRKVHDMQVSQIISLSKIMLIAFELSLQYILKSIKYNLYCIQFIHLHQNLQFSTSKEFKC